MKITAPWVKDPASLVVVVYKGRYNAFDAFTVWEVTIPEKTPNALYLPLYTTTTRDAGSFTQGAVIFNTTVKKLEYYDGTNWKSIPEVSTGLVLALDS